MHDSSPDVQVTARRAAVRARLPGRSWAGIISYMYRTSPPLDHTVCVFGPRLNSKYIDKQGSRERERVQKTWNKCVA
jgi:hypothetical protein